MEEMLDLQELEEKMRLTKDQEEERAFLGFEGEE